jgi:hypothetical protein
MTELDNNNTDFSAVGSLTGYLYQCRYALFRTLQRLKKNNDFSIAIETIDDISFESTGEPIELLQTKHHLNAHGNITNTAPDLWKTIRIWCEKFIDGSVPQDATRFLVTNAAAAEGSACHYLKEANGIRETEKAIERLNAVAQTSTSQPNMPAYKIYQSLQPDQKIKLFESVFVLDGEPSIIELNQALREEVYYAVEERFMDPFLLRLEGWWFRRAIEHLAKKSDKAILSQEISEQFTLLREQFKRENLPIDEDIVATVVNASGYDSRVFVQQLRLIEVGNPRIMFAIRDYYRAFTQRSRWLREDLLNVGELDRYEKQLMEEWGFYFEQMRDKLGENAAEEEKRKTAQALYEWIETGNLKCIRRDCTAGFIARGSYHWLADSQQVGWHLEFRERLKILLAA